MFKANLVESSKLGGEQALHSLSRRGRGLLTLPELSERFMLLSILVEQLRV